MDGMHIHESVSFLDSTTCVAPVAKFALIGSLIVYSYIDRL
jgi:hypothetical protein